MRRLENWVDSFLDWTLPRSEAAISLVLWSGLFSIASVAKRHVFFSEDIMGSYRIYPNLYILFVGPAGAVKKSTTAGYAEKLLNELESITQASTAMSDSKLIELMSKTNDSSVTVISSEFGSFIKTSQEGMYTFLTDIWDGKVKFDYATRMYGIELSENPCINLIGATTPDWIATQAKEHMTGQGFSSRVIFIFEDQVRQRRLYYNLDRDYFANLHTDLVNDLEHIAEIEGEFEHDSVATMAFMENWYQRMFDELGGDPRMEGYRNRKHVHIHKIAGILSLAERDDRIVTKEHFTRAIRLFDKIEERMPRALITATRNPHAGEIERIIDFLRACGGTVEKRIVLQRFIKDFQNKAALDEMIDTMVAIGDIESYKERKGNRLLIKLSGVHNLSTNGNNNVLLEDEARTLSAD